MDKLICEQCDLDKFIVLFAPGFLTAKCANCDEEYHTVLPADLYPWPAPKED